MAKTGEIASGSNINPVSVQIKGTEYELSHGKGKPEKFTNLRKGEIVYGKVLERLTKKLIRVKLPNGQFKAVLKGNLKSGDQLYFRVESNKPVLVLNVHSVNTKVGGKQLSTAELLRILDLPTHSFYRDLVKFLASNQNIVGREDVAFFYSAYLAIGSEKVEKDTLDRFFKVIFAFKEAGITTEEASYNKVSPLFASEKELASIIESMVKNLNSQTRALPPDMEKIKILIEKNEFLVFYPFYDENREPRLLESLDSLYRRSKQEPLKNMLKLLGAYYLWNSLMMLKKLPIQVLIPVVIGRKYELIRAYFAFSKNTGANSRLLFSFDVTPDSIGKIRTIGATFNSGMDLRILSESKDYISKFQNESEFLINKLKETGFKLKNISYGTFEELNDSSQSSPKNFSIVV